MDDDFPVMPWPMGAAPVATLERRSYVFEGRAIRVETGHGPDGVLNRLVVEAAPAPAEDANGTEGVRTVELFARPRLGDRWFAMRLPDRPDPARIAAMTLAWYVKDNYGIDLRHDRPAGAASGQKT